METLTWIDPDGNQYPLTVASDRLVRGRVQGRIAPPVEMTEERVPEQPGARLRQVVNGVREVAVPFGFWGESPAELLVHKRTLTVAMDPTRGEGRLRSEADDGTQRDLPCRYAGGLELIEDHPLRQPAVLVFRAHQPYWLDVNVQSNTFTTGQTATFFPFFPLRLSGSEVFAGTTIVNDGDVETWPVWDITGPGSELRLVNVTTGRRLELATVLGVGGQVTIDTRPFVKTVTLDDGTNLFGDLSYDSDLWPLVRGPNAIRIEMVGATADSQVQLTWQRRWLTA